MRFFATCAKATEPLVAAELRALGAETEQRVAGVAFDGGLETAYRACLWSRVASRVLLPLGSFAAPDPDALYAGVRALSWIDELVEGGTIAVDFSSTRSQITHTQFGAQKTKDAIVDQLRDETGWRPSVDRARPDLRVNVHLGEDVATVSVDLSGDSLHRRGYRADGAPAPLKETLAAAVLLLAGWPEAATRGASLLDPMCGSGTLPIEAALMAREIAPGLLRARFGFLGWRRHDAALWQRLTDEAEARRRSDGPTIVGYDHDADMVRAALGNVEAAGLRGAVHIERRELETLEPLSGPPGLLVTNPPYGERLGEEEELGPLYQSLGDSLRHRFMGWNAFVLSGNPQLSAQIGLKPRRRHILFNGAIECRLLDYPISSAPVVVGEGPRWRREAEALTPGAEMFRNRLQKNYKHWRKWAEREGIHCYRVYDADLPEYAAAIDLYEDAAHVQEYAPPKTIEPEQAERRLRELTRLVPEVLGIAPANVFLKVRKRQRPTTQYRRLDDSAATREVREGGMRFVVNLSDYLDTGLFLDHRRIRALVGAEAKGRRFLNLFAYTGTASLYAAFGGALSTTSVDLSNTYLDWAEANFRLAGVGGPSHELVRADVLEWLPDERRRFGLIFMAPPTFSNSKSMSDSLDVQRDHVQLIRGAGALLEHDGVLFFSNHFRRFKMDFDSLPEYDIVNISDETLPKDFDRSPRIHNAWRITRRR